MVSRQDSNKENKNKLQDADTRLVKYKHSVEHSLLNELRKKLAQKQIEIVVEESKLAGKLNLIHHLEGKVT
jgi:hypothetical protein